MFERKDEEEYFREMATLQQTTTAGTYVGEFQRILVMVTDVSDNRITFLFMKGLKEPLKVLVKAFDPLTLQDAIKRALTLEDSTLPRTKQVTPCDVPLVQLVGP